MPELAGDSPLRHDMPINRAFADVPQDEPKIHAEGGFEGQLHAFSLFNYLSRFGVTWKPSVTAVCKAPLACPTTEEFILPVFHGTDRVEWFIQLSDEIVWDVGAAALRERRTVAVSGRLLANLDNLENGGGQRAWRPANEEWRTG